MLNNNNDESSTIINKSNGTPNIILANGTRVTSTYVRSIHGGTIVNIWAFDTNGAHVASKSYVFKTEEQMLRKRHIAVNELKTEILSYEAHKFAQGNKNPALVIAFITKRHEELKIEKL